MEIIKIILEILKYTIPSIVVLVGVSVIVKRFLANETEKKHLALFGKRADETMRLRLAAYERLAHYMERIHPNALIGRHYNKGLTAQDVQLAMIRNIREEYEHNISQQLYVSNEVWQAVKAAKEQEISMINQIGSQLKIGASSTELVQRISEFALDAETEVPTDIALFLINKEAKQVLMAQDTHQA